MRPDESRILDVLVSAEEIAEYIAGQTYDDYLKHGWMRAAVERKVYIVGEACRQLTETFKNAHPSIPWQQIIGARNVLAHEYGKVDHKIMWNIATRHVPDLAA